MNSKILDIDYTVGEVELSYKPQFKKLHKVASSEDAYKYLLPTYKKGTICYKEYFKVLFLNQASQVLGYTLISAPIIITRQLWCLLSVIDTV